MKKGFIIGLALAGLLTGCGGQELADVTLIQTLGVDGPGPVELTALGEGETGENLYTVRGEDAARAQEGLAAVGDTRLTVTHVAQLVLGPGAQVEETLWQELAHRESGYGATVWLAQGPMSAGELLAGAEKASARLKSLEENAEVAAPTILTALSDLERQGWVELPVLTREAGRLQVSGWRRITREEG